MQSIFPHDSQPRVSLRMADWQALASHVIDAYPNESVGIITSADGHLSAGYARLDNKLTGRAFSVVPDSLRRVLADMERTELRPLILCHSHPDGSADPSIKDIRKLKTWPALVGIVAVARGRAVDFRVFALEDMALRNVPVTVVEL